MSLNFSYQLKKSSRTTAIRINIDHQGTVLVTAPSLYPNFLIDKFLKQQEAWIIKKQAEAAKLQVKIKHNETYIFGDKYQIVLNIDPKQDPISSVKISKLSLLNSVLVHTQTDWNVF